MASLVSQALMQNPCGEGAGTGMLQGGVARRLGTVNSLCTDL